MFFHHNLPAVWNGVQCLWVRNGASKLYLCCIRFSIRKRLQQILQHFLKESYCWPSFLISLIDNTSTVSDEVFLFSNMWFLVLVGVVFNRSQCELMKTHRIVPLRFSLLLSQNCSFSQIMLWIYDSLVPHCVAYCITHHGTYLHLKYFSPQQLLTRQGLEFDKKTRVFFFRPFFKHVPKPFVCFCT